MREAPGGIQQAFKNDNYKKKNDNYHWGNYYCYYFTHSSECYNSAYHGPFAASYMSTCPISQGLCGVEGCVFFIISI